MGWSMWELASTECITHILNHQTPCPRNCSWTVCDWQTGQGAPLQYRTFMIYQKLISYVSLCDTITLVWHHNNWLWQVALLCYINKEYIYSSIHPSHTFRHPKLAGLLSNQPENYTDTIWTKQKTQLSLTTPVWDAVLLHLQNHSLSVVSFQSSIFASP